MSAGTAVAVINYISQIFSPVESLGMEIQTIQSAVAGIHRINEFYALEEKEVLQAQKRVAKDRTVISVSHRTSAELGRIIIIA